MAFFIFTTMKVLAIIPARYASTRFPGKPLVQIAGKSMIQRVYEQSKKSKLIDRVIVATDHNKIEEELIKIGADYMLTSENHVNGTERCAEVVNRLKENYDIILNIQGDEPFIQANQLDQLIQSFNHKETQISTLIKPINHFNSLENPNEVKVVKASNNKALYFSRSPIPHVRGVKMEEWLNHQSFYSHIGVYGFRKEVLLEIVNIPQGKLEKAESLEQLRWLEAGYYISVNETNFKSLGVDTSEDLIHVENFLKQNPEFI